MWAGTFRNYWGGKVEPARRSAPSVHHAASEPQNNKFVVSCSAPGSRRRPAGGGIQVQFARPYFMSVCGGRPRTLRARPCHASPALTGVAPRLRKTCKHRFEVSLLSALWSQVLVSTHTMRTPRQAPPHDLPERAVWGHRWACRAPHHDPCHSACRSLYDEWRHWCDPPFPDDHTTRAWRVQFGWLPTVGRYGLDLWPKPPPLPRTVSTSRCSPLSHCTSAAWPVEGGAEMWWIRLFASSKAFPSFFGVRAVLLCPWRDFGGVGGGAGLWISAGARPTTLEWANL